MLKVIELYPSFYCACLKNYQNEEKIFFQKDITPQSNRCRLDLFESPEAMYSWVESEHAAFRKNGDSKAYYEGFYPKKMTSSMFLELIHINDSIDSISIIDNQGIRRVYYRDDFLGGFEQLLVPKHSFYAKEPIYMINRQKKLNDQTIVQKDSYFVVYPEVAVPLFSFGILEWAEELISRTPNEDYYIEKTTFSDLYMRLSLSEDDPGLFILSKEEAPHYLLRKRDIKKIVEGTYGC